ncbi:MAG: SIMPL domain-containing protein [Candidatus Buchananbacteria bacterium]|nr:SIMPL domain-containing protein [Candidatus Buchananbacteria bacterium]
MEKQNWSNPKIILSLIAMLLIAGVVTVSILRDRIVNQQIWQVSITGEGKVAYQPDIAIINLGIQIDRAKTPDSAITQLKTKMDKVIASIKALNIADDDIQTQGYSVYTQYDYVDNISTLAGYNANQQLIVKVKNLQPDSDIIANLVSQATKAGVNQINGISFDASNLEQLKQAARLKAIADARQKADTLAQAAGIKLGKVVGWWDNIVQAPGPIQYYADGKGGLGMGGGQTVNTSIPSGGNEIIVDVNLNYQVK